MSNNGDRIGKPNENNGKAYVSPLADDLDRTIVNIVITIVVYAVVNQNGGYSRTIGSLFCSAWSACACLTTLKAETHATAKRTTTVVFNKTILSDVRCRLQNEEVWYRAWTDTDYNEKKYRRSCWTGTKLLDNSSKQSDQLPVATRNNSVHGSAVLLTATTNKMSVQMYNIIIDDSRVCVTCVLFKYIKIIIWRILVYVCCILTRDSWDNVCVYVCV